MCSGAGIFLLALVNKLFTIAIEKDASKKAIVFLEDYLSELNNEFYKIENCFEKIMILSKINELVFWLEMYKEKKS